MTTAFWFLVGQTVVFVAVCGFALWAARVIAEAADNSAMAAEQAGKAARDAETAAADIRAMRNMLETWLDEQRTEADRGRQALGPLPVRREGTDTAEVQAVLTPQAIIDRGTDTGSVEPSPRSTRGRHAVPTETPWSAALRAATSRSNRDK